MNEVYIFVGAETEFGRQINQKPSDTYICPPGSNPSDINSYIKVRHGKGPLQRYYGLTKEESQSYTAHAVNWHKEIVKDPTKPTFFMEEGSPKVNFYYRSYSLEDVNLLAQWIMDNHPAPMKATPLKQASQSKLGVPSIKDLLSLVERGVTRSDVECFRQRGICVKQDQHIFVFSFVKPQNGGLICFDVNSPHTI